MIKNDFEKLKNDSSYRNEQIRKNDITMFVFLSVMLPAATYGMFNGRALLIAGCLFFAMVFMCAVMIKSPLDLLKDTVASYQNGFKSLVYRKRYLPK